MTEPTRVAQASDFLEKTSNAGGEERSSPTEIAPTSVQPSDHTLTVPSVSAGPPAGPFSRLPCAFGNYDLLEEIARGGMGVVYKARQRGLDRLVALKMILAGAQATARDLQRFAREARATAALDHPNIVPVYENGWQDGYPFFTMALIDGASLQQQVQQHGPPGPAEAVRLLRAVADGVAYAHERGVVHRDLKPHNVLLDRSGRPRVADFGLARRLQEGEGLTGAGQVLGTPNYMAPEQALGEAAAAGPPVDVYALGGLLYFLLTGQPPFSGPDAVSVLRRVVDEPPRPPRQINADAPPELQAICLKCLEKDPARRYPSAAALAAALAEWEARQGPAAPPAPPRTRRRLAGLLGAAAAVTVAGVLFALGLRGWLGHPNATPPTNPAPPDTPVVLPELPKDLRHDFGLKVQLVGGREGPGGLRLFTEDEPVRFRVETERDAYLGIWTVGPDGTVVQLFPNDHDSDHLVRAGTRLVPPDKPLLPGDRRYTIDATATPPGKAELLRVVAATRRWAPLEGEKHGPFVALRPAEQGRFERHLRSLVVRPKADPERAGTDAVAEEVLLYRVLPR
jgi:eukaryotic-like serine/threonine-protein kinase